MSIYGLADCNNFFVSCERVFRPALEGRPAVVLSSNDGCIVARSDEAKALGVKMAPAGVPGERPHRAAQHCRHQRQPPVLYRHEQPGDAGLRGTGPGGGEILDRRMFLDLMGIPEDLTAFCQRLKHSVRQWTGLPISIGIAETKTLAKIANRLAEDLRQNERCSRSHR